MSNAIVSKVPDIIKVGVLMESVTVAADRIESYESSASAEAEALVEQRRSPGIIIVAPPMRILQMSQSAWELLRDVAEVEHRSGKAHAKLARGLLPSALCRLCTQLFAHPRKRPVAKDWQCVESRCGIGAPQRPVLVRAFGVPDHSGREQSQVILLLEQVVQRKEHCSKKTTPHFRFTEREQEVIQCLARGWRNKEIASHLGLALPTVKEHVRHIMDKAKTNTRTGILAQVFCR